MNSALGQTVEPTSSISTQTSDRRSDSDSFWVKTKDQNGFVEMKTERPKGKNGYKKTKAFSGDNITVYDLTKETENEPLCYSFGECLVKGDAHFNRDSDCSSLPPACFSDKIEILGWCAAMLSESPLARYLWRNAQVTNWQIGICDLDNGGYYIDIQDKKIWLDHYMMEPEALSRSAYFRNSILVSLIRALRDIWHESHGNLCDYNIMPEDILLLERMLAADCSTVMIMTGWELRSAGHAEVWRHLLGSEDGDMAMVFSRFLEREPKSLFDGSVLIHTFRQWFADENRVDGCDHVTLEDIDDVLQIAEETNPFGSERLAPEFVELLSALPDGLHYLDGFGEWLLSDPAFSGLGDQINQAHFFQILYDLEVVMINNVPFRDRELGRLIFPQSEITKSWR